MTKQIHSPGTWTISTTQRAKGNLVEVMDDNNMPICRVYRSGTAYGAMYNQPQEANARLIAAAPELEAFLTTILSIPAVVDLEKRHTESGYASPITDARALLEKIRGES